MREGTHKVSGRLRDEKSPLRAALVTLHGEENKEVSSDNEGRFSVEGVSPGSYRITVRHKGIDPIYADSSTTPLKVNVGKDLENLNVIARKKAPALGARKRR